MLTTMLTTTLRHGRCAIEFGWHRPIFRRVFDGMAPVPHTAGDE
jgi:hypothetical protein